MRDEISVGPSGADVTGTDNRAIQIAIDAMAARMGGAGGTVRVRSGDYLFHDAVRLRPKIALVGEREGTILRHGPVFVSDLAVDADVAEQIITPRDPSGFRPGMGVCIHDQTAGWGFVGRPRVITRIEGGVLQLDALMDEERCAEESGIVANYAPLILAQNADEASVDGFTLDGTVRATGNSDAVEKFERAKLGLRPAQLLFRTSRNAVIRNVTVRNAPGDGIGFNDASIGALVEDCEVAYNQWYGLHPGSHSSHCRVRRCNIHHNGSDGLYICWGIHHSRFEENEIHHNGWRQLRNGISIGHKDVDNLIVANHIYENCKFGICFRQKTEANGAHRCVVRSNTIENNGTRAGELEEVKQKLAPLATFGCGIYVCGITKDLTLEQNIIRETRRGKDATQIHGVYIAAGVTVSMDGNTIEGHSDAGVVDLSKKQQ